MRKLHTQLIAFCDYATISQDNKLSVMGIFDQVRVTQLPGGIARAFFVAIVVGEQDSSYKLTVSGEQGSKTVFPPIQIDMHTGSNGQHNMLIDLVNIGFPEEGKYDFFIRHNKEVVGSTSLQVIHVKQYGKQQKQPN